MSELFNKEALQALDDKSELKEMPRVASPALWLILTSLLTICAIALFWCIFGKLNYTVNATGVVFPFAEARPISVPFEGTVHHVIATNGQKVAAGDPIASVRSQLATTTLTSPESGVVLTSKPAETKFVAREPVVWILPQELQLHEREVLAYVPFAHLRKVKIGAKVQGLIVSALFDVEVVKPLLREVAQKRAHLLELLSSRNLCRLGWRSHSTPMNATKDRRKADRQRQQRFPIHAIHH